MKTNALLKHLKHLWASAIDLLIDSVLGVVWLTVIVTLMSVGLGTIPVLGFGVLLIMLAGAVTRMSGWVERVRAEAVYGIRISPLERRSTKVTNGWRWIVQGFVDLVDPATWRTILHHLLSAVLGGILVALWGLLVRLVVLSAGGWLLLPVLLIGLAVLVAYIYLVGMLDRMLTAELLGRGTTAQLQEKVETLADARRGAVDAASIERQRIERNLHDGVQPQLVNVALTLGMAKSKFATDPDAALALIEQAHSETKASITELRQLARGIHPAVLTDRGLDAALSAVASRCTVPTTIRVELAERAAPEAEAVIYFAVSEALTNVAKHSGASGCSVAVSRVDAGDGGCRLVARIVDDGRGGASIGDGLGQGGLAGMRDRVRAAGGTLVIESPVGGPTQITVEVPCAS